MRRLIISPDMAGLDREHGIANINGPSLIRVPPWVAGALGKYYLYFAHHIGAKIRLAYADHLAGPWAIHAPGALRLEDTPFVRHIASPDVHVDGTNGRILMYYHGSWGRDGDGEDGGQCGGWAVSTDGVHFATDQQVHTSTPEYLRAFEWNGGVYATCFDIISRAPGWAAPFERREAPLFSGRPRHTANRLDGDVLTVYYSRIGDAPERILKSTVKLTGDWNDWSASQPQEVLAPREPFEGADLPVVPSVGGYAPQPAHQLRHPAIFREDGRTWLLYSVAGEHGIGIVELTS
jgi:hypothetical protein